MEEGAYANGAEYSEDQSYQQPQEYDTNFQQQPNESGDGGKRFSKDDDERKLFVGGLTVDTRKEDLEEYFSKFGTISDCVLKMDQDTGRSRCFGFIVYEDKASLEDALSRPKEEHMIKGKQVDPKKAKARQSGGIKKIFVGGVPTEVTEEEIQRVFSEYGTIDDIDLPVDKRDGKETRRGFIFVSFENEQDVATLVERGTVELGGKSVDIKKATPKTENNQFGGQRGGRGRGGGRGGRGGYNNGGQWGGNQWGGNQWGGNQWGGNQWGGNQGYDYQGYGYGGGYDGYGYNNQGYGGGWGGYDPSYYGGYDYSGWGYGNQGAEGGGEQGGSSGGYKQRGGGSGGSKGGYHPYSRS